MDFRKLNRVTLKGSYEFLRMPSGLCNVPATFKRLLLHVLKNQDGVVVIFLKTVDELVPILTAVLEIIKRAGLKLSAKVSDWS